MANQMKELEEQQALISCLEHYKHLMGRTSAQWAGSRLAWLRRPSPKEMGTVCELAMALWLDGTKGNGVDCDIIVNGVGWELKAATMNEAGHVQFNQIRPTQQCDVILLAIAPSGVCGWTLAKDIACRVGRRQHAGGEDTLAINFSLKAPPSFLSGSGSLTRLKASVQGSRAGAGAGDLFSRP